MRAEVPGRGQCIHETEKDKGEWRGRRRMLSRRGQEKDQRTGRGATLGRLLCVPCFRVPPMAVLTTVGWLEHSWDGWQ